MKWWFWLYNKGSIKIPETVAAAPANLNSSIICPEERALLPQ